MTSSDNVLPRDADQSDVPALAELHVRTFNETHGPGPDSALRERQWREKFAKPDLLLFCVVLEAEGGQLVGFAAGQPHLDAELSSYRGELNKIYLLREYQGRGLGRVLLCAAARRFLDRGITSMLLFGDARSPSNGFYEAMGGERLLSAEGEFHGGYGWRDLRTVRARCPPPTS
jgi:ribosomal protein S18 acetylase RimI-like enzyme